MSMYRVERSSVCVHQVELSGERCRGEEVRGRLEGELGETRERLREKTEKLVSAEDTLLASRQQVYTLRYTATTSLTRVLFQHCLYTSCHTLFHQSLHQTSKGDVLLCVSDVNMDVFPPSFRHVYFPLRCVWEFPCFISGMSSCT